MIIEHPNVSRFLTAGSGEDTVKTAALLAGCIWAVPNAKNLLEEPISTTMNGVIYGGLCAMSASYIAEHLPPKGKCVFAGIIGISALYHLGKTVYNTYNGIYLNVQYSPLIQITRVSL